MLADGFGGLDDVLVAGTAGRLGRLRAEPTSLAGPVGEEAAHVVGGAFGQGDCGVFTHIYICVSWYE
jgi:hypothetical protein